MGYTLRMSDEVHEWLAQLRASDPSAARLVAEALTALMREGAGLGPPLVNSVAAYRPAVNVVRALDETYQTSLERLQVIRRRVADAAMAAKRLRDQIATLEAADDPANQDQLS